MADSGGTESGLSRFHTYLKKKECIQVVDEKLKRKNSKSGD
jgi:hypothetical protein